MSDKAQAADNRAPWGLGRRRFSAPSIARNRTEMDEADPTENCPADGEAPGRHTQSPTTARRSLGDATLQQSSHRTLPLSARRQSGGYSKTGGRQWIVQRDSTWRTAPTAVSMKIGQFRQGETVVEAYSPCLLAPGWVPIEPRGYARACDLVPLDATGDESPCVTGASATLPATAVAPALPASGRSAPSRPVTGRLDAVSSAASTCTVDNISTREVTSQGPDGVSVLSLREEAVRLREEAVALRELEIASQQALDALRREKVDVAAELEKLRAECDRERRQVEAYKRQGSEMRKRLVRCRFAVVQAVASVDHLYAQPDDIAARDQAALAGVAVSHLLKVEEAANVPLAEDEAEVDEELDETTEDGAEADQENARLDLLTFANKVLPIEHEACNPGKRRKPLGECNTMVH